MPNHFAAVGLDVWDEDQLEELASRAVEHGQAVDAPARRRFWKWRTRP